MMVQLTPSLKRAKRGEINRVPDHLENHSDDSLEDERLALVEELFSSGQGRVSSHHQQEAKRQLQSSL